MDNLNCMVCDSKFNKKQTDSIHIKFYCSCSIISVFPKNKVEENYKFGPTHIIYNDFKYRLYDASLFEMNGINFPNYDNYGENFLNDEDIIKRNKLYVIDCAKILKIYVDNMIFL